MNKKLKKDITKYFDAQMTESHMKNRDEFLNKLHFPKEKPIEFFLTQIGYIRKGFWICSILIMTVILIIANSFEISTMTIGTLSALLPFLTLIGIVEIQKNISYNMAEIEMSCKHNISEVSLIRITAIGTFHFVILVAILLFIGNNRYNILNICLYLITPFLVTNYLSLAVINHIKTRETLYVCGGVVGLVSILTIIISSSKHLIYTSTYTPIWIVTVIIFGALVVLELIKFIKKTESLV